MKAFWVLTKLQILQAFSLNQLIKSGKKWKIAGILVGVVYLVAVLGFCVYFMANGIAEAFSLLGQMELYPPLIAALVCVSTLFFSMLRASTTLFSVRELEITLAMPVKLSSIVASRVMGLYLANLPFALIASVPAILPYIRIAAPGPGFYPVYLVLLLVTPLLPVVLASIVGALVALVASRFRGAKYLNMLLLLAVTLGAMYASMRLSASAGGGEIDMAGVGAMLSGGIARLYPLAGLYTRALVHFDLLALFGFAGISIVIFALFAFALGKVFLPFSAAIHASRARSDYRIEGLKRSNLARTLLAREWRHLMAVPMWALNSLFGLVLGLVGVVVLAFQRSTVLDLLGEMFGAQAAPVGALLAFALSWLASMSCITGCSISLEGRTLWLVKSLPVRGADVLNAKLVLNLIIVLPTSALIGALAAFSMGLPALDWLWLILVPALYSLMTIQAGLLGNLKWHRFDWTNEITVVKQSMGTMFPVLLSMLTTMPMLYVAAITPNLNLLMGILAAALAAVDIALYAAIRKNAERWYANL